MSNLGNMHLAYSMNASNSVGASNRAPLLNKDNYEDWALRIKNYLIRKGPDVWKSVEEGPYEPPRVLLEGPVANALGGPQYAPITEEDIRRLDCDHIAFTELLSGIPPDLASLIIHFKDAKSIWDNLQSRLQGTAKTREKRIEQTLMTYESFKLQPDENIRDASNRFMILLGKLNEGKQPDAPDRINRSEYEQNVKFFHALGDE